MELLKSPFLNDPSSLVAQAFTEIYPGTEYEAILVDKITAEDGTEMVGCTTFPDDGTLPLIEVAGHIPAEAVPEILAHELAHIVTVGDEHGPEWKKAFEAIYSKYNELAIARFGAQEPEENQRREDVSLRVSQTQICFYIVGGDAYQIHKSHSEKAEHHRDQLG